MYPLPCQLRDGRALQGDLTQQVSGDREAGPGPADCPPRPSAAAGVKKQLPWCLGRGMRPLRPAGHSHLCPVRWDKGSGQGGSAGKGQAAQECQGVGEGPAPRGGWPHHVPSGNWGPAGRQLPSQPGCPGVRAEQRPCLRGGACLGLLRGFGGAHSSAPRVLGEGCGSWGGVSAWPADLRQVTVSHWAPISSCVKWDKSSTLHRGTPRETMHLKRLAEFTPSGVVRPGVPTPGSHWAEGFQLLQALEEQEGLPWVPPPQPAKSILGGISSQWAGGWQRQCQWEHPGAKG